MDASIPHHSCFDYTTDFFQETFNSNMQLPFLTNSPVSSFPDQFGGCMLLPQMSEIETRIQQESTFFCPPAYNYNPMPAENWAKVEEMNEVKVGRYSVEERKDRILRYLKKRNRRNFNKTIKYACRKTLADKRVRVRGRFAKNKEARSEDETLITITHGHDDSFQQKMKYEEDDWLEAAMEDLGQWPYLAI